MQIRSKARPMLAAFAAMATILAGVGYGSAALADDSALAEQVKILMQRVEDLTKEVQSLKKQPAAAPAPAQVAAAAPAAKPAAPAEPKFDAFLKGIYGVLDVSFDDATKGMNGMVAHHFGQDANGNWVVTGDKGGNCSELAPAAAPARTPCGRVGYLPALSTNKSQIGIRGSHQIGTSNTNFIYQVETSLGIASGADLRTSNTRQSNVVTGAIGLGDTFVGLQGKDWGRVKVGSFYSPYKKATDVMNPFSGMLGDYAVVMGNSGGDNRVEFGTRLNHSIAYESSKWSGFSFDLLWSPGQNRTYDNIIQSEGAGDCTGGNMPGSGNLMIGCDDGGFGDAFSVALKYEFGGFYGTAAYEVHKDVNRNSDGIGANNPSYGNLYTGGPGGTAINCDPNLDCATFNDLVAEFPGYGGVASPGYLTDIGNETALKVGVQYKFGIPLTVSAIWERLHRSIPAALEFQNERTRNNATWFAATYDLTGNDNFSVGWAHAGRTPGDPGGQHNYNPGTTDDSANMYTAAWKHKFDKQLYWYVDWAVTVNHGNVHYDLGAGGRALTTDCHDGTHTPVTDYSSFGPTTWGGCRIEGFSTGLNYKF